MHDFSTRGPLMPQSTHLVQPQLTLPFLLQAPVRRTRQHARALPVVLPVSAHPTLLLPTQGMQLRARTARVQPG